jgi:transposase
MPWKESTIMEQKIEFICEWRTGKYTITELCRVFKISRPTAYKTIARFENEGYEGLRSSVKKPKDNDRFNLETSMPKHCFNTLFIS